MLLIILYIHIKTLKYINCIIKCNIVLYSYFPHIKLLNILYMHLHILKYINCIINCNIVPYSYFPLSVTTYPVYTSTDFQIYTRKMSI